MRKRRLLEAKSFGEFGEKWLTAAPMADSTRAVRGRSSSASCCPGGANRLLTQITPDDLRAHCGAIVETRCAGDGDPHPRQADRKGGDAADHPARHASLLQTMVRKSELQDATWDEVDFENAVWTIPKERMKRSKAHDVYLSRHTLDIMVALKTCAGNSRYLLCCRRAMTRMRRCRVRHSIVSLTRLLSWRRRKVCRWSRSSFTTCGGPDPLRPPTFTAPPPDPAPSPSVCGRPPWMQAESVVGYEHVVRC